MATHDGNDSGDFWYPLVNIQKATWKMAIEIGDLPTRSGDFP